MGTRCWRQPETAAARLRLDLVSASIFAAVLFLMRPLLHKSLSYTVFYAVTWFALSLTLAVARFVARRRRQGE